MANSATIEQAVKNASLAGKMKDASDLTGLLTYIKEWEERMDAADAKTNERMGMESKSRLQDNALYLRTCEALENIQKQKRFRIAARNR